MPLFLSACRQHFSSTPASHRPTRLNRSGGGAASADLLDVPLPPPPPESKAFGGAGSLSSSSSASRSARLLDLTDAPPSPPQPSSSTTSSSHPQHQQQLSLGAPASDSVRDIANTKCPLCAVPVHVKELLQHVHNFHPAFTDREQLRRLVRERYTMLHGAIKRVWSLTAPRGSQINKLKGGYPCAHCGEDETGLAPLFPTVDELMKHIQDAHEDTVPDMDAVAPPPRMSPEDVQAVIDRLRNGTNVAPLPAMPGRGGEDGSLGVGDLMASGEYAAMMAGGAGEGAGAASVYRCEHCGRGGFESDHFLMQHYESSHPEVFFASEGVVEEMFGASGAASEQRRNGIAGWVPPVPAPWAGIPRRLVTIPAAPEDMASSSTAPAHASTVAAAIGGGETVIEVATAVQHQPGVLASEMPAIVPPPAPDAMPGAPPSSSASTTPQFETNPATTEPVARRPAFRCDHCGRSKFSCKMAFADHLRDKHGVPQAVATATANAAALQQALVGDAAITAAAGASSATAAAAAAAAATPSAAGYECVHCHKKFTTFAGLEEHSRKKHVGAMPPSAAMQQQHVQQQQHPIYNAAPPQMPQRPASAPAALHVPSLRGGVPDAPPAPVSSSSSSPDFIPPLPPVVGKHGAIVPPHVAQQQQAVWFCNTCNRGFDSGKALLGHNQGKHSYRSQPIPCPGCKRTCPDVFSLLDHVSSQHPHVDVAQYAALCEGFACSMCGSRFLSQRELDVHELLTHSGNKQKQGGGGGGGSTAGRSSSTAQRFKTSF